MIKVGALRADELEEASRILRLAFGTFLSLPNPMDFMGDWDFVTPRWRAHNTKILAARENGKLIGSSIATRWGLFAFFGPITVLPEYWNHGVAQQLLKATMKVFDGWACGAAPCSRFRTVPGTWVSTRNSAIGQAR